MIKDLDVIIPIAIELDWPTVDSIVEAILHDHREYGFTRFALSGPCGGWRSVGYPGTEVFRKQAELSKEVIRRVKPYGISCGWWITLTVKNGSSEAFQNMVKFNGTEAPFSPCPLDRAFQKQFASDIALFAKIADPDFIITEDDYSIASSTGSKGCFCEKHLQEFAKREGRSYTREELVAAIDTDYDLLRRWRELMKDSLVELSAAIRAQVDKETPHIPIGYMQAGGIDGEGDATEAICRALAGPNHTPFCRFYGAGYCNVVSKKLPVTLFHPLYSIQHTPKPFTFYHESDTYPHTRFYTSSRQMNAVFATVYSYGYEGSTFQTQQLLDDPCEEPVFGAMFARERKRFNAVHRLAAQCRVEGVHVHYDPFWNRVTPREGADPLWIEALSLMGISYTTLDADIVFWDDRQGRFCDEAQVKKALSGTLFMDGACAKALCDRGFGEYLGVSMGEDVASGNYGFDLGAREVLMEGYHGKGVNMPSSHMYAQGKNGKLLRMTVTDPACQVLSEARSFQNELQCPAMTRFKNSLGGTVIVMGTTLWNNRSHNLLNYRRARLFQQLLVEADAQIAMVKNSACVFAIMNQAEHADFEGMLTLINLSEDPQEKPTLYLPRAWRNKKYFFVDEEGLQQPLPCACTEDGISLEQELPCLAPLYIVIK